MPTYTVKVTQRTVAIVTVNATDEEDAETQADQALDCGENRDGTPIHVKTLDDEWEVEQED